MYESRACIIDKCPNNGRIRSRYCAACAHSFYYWEVKTKKMGLAAIIERQDKLEKWQNRMMYLGNRDKEMKDVARTIKRRTGR